MRQKNRPPMSMNTQDKFNTAMAQYKKSIQVLLILPHGVLLTILFPKIVFYTIAIAFMFIVLYVWVDLIHTIEEAHRMDILNLIHTSSCQGTIEILSHELYLHDQNSIAGHRPFNLHGI